MFFMAPKPKSKLSKEEKKKKILNCYFRYTYVTYLYILPSYHMKESSVRKNNNTFLTAEKK
jgi:hypothetical protein